MKLGFIGLGRMGANMTKKLLADGHGVAVWNRSPEKVEALKSEVRNQKLEVASSIEDLIRRLDTPRVVWSMVNIGEPTDEVLQEIAKYVVKEDIVIEGSNANWKDTRRRYEEFTKKGIRYLGTGVAGGIHGPKFGYALMVGGDKSAYDYIVPILATLAAPKSGHEYYGKGGAGHFVKMIHNAIEYGYMQAIGEGFDVLEHAPFKFDLPRIAKQWAKNSLVSGFMMDRAVEVLENDPHMKDLDGVIDATGEAQWTVDSAKELGIPVEIIEASLTYRKRSKTDPKIQKSFTARMVAALRQAFGAHGVKKN